MPHPEPLGSIIEFFPIRLSPLFKKKIDKNESEVEFDHVLAFSNQPSGTEVVMGIKIGLVYLAVFEQHQINVKIQFLNPDFENVVQMDLSL